MINGTFFFFPPTFYLYLFILKNISATVYILNHSGHWNQKQNNKLYL